MDRPAIPAPPKDWKPEAKKCNHDFVFLYSDFSREAGTYNDSYEQRDTFFCRYCLEYKTVIARQENSRTRPPWYRG
ncbi:hypothetical protein ET33_21200 [Paenibacillus tyrfis]|uniref:Uncharacterized protein n=1 Tax=Paenibacillus tyrfis TaxID=1501230 RepID=A0A081NWP3_9BACL|nr:hypothetical protein ET33_21200 [Paenibacillus tyrfis]